MGVAVEIFKGEIPKNAPRLLALGFAQRALNLKLSDGKFRPWYGLKFQATPTKSGEIKSIYPLRDPGTGVAYWLHWTQDVNVVPGPIAGDTTQRIYWTGEGAPKASNYALATTNAPSFATGYPYNAYRLGVPRPASAPTIGSVSGVGSGTAIDRQYFVTFVHVWPDGKTDEGMPSDASAIATVQTGQTVNLTGIPRYVNAITSLTRSGSVVTAVTTRPHGLANGDIATISGAAQSGYNVAAPVNVVDSVTFQYTIATTPTTPATGSPVMIGQHNITKKWLYRTVSGNSGTFARFVAELNESDTTYADSASDSTIALNRAIASTYWDMPPADMTSLCEINGDTMVGISGNQVCFCEPGYPHAWPQAYRYAIPYAAVAVATVGKSAVVGALGKPYIFTGDHPSAMSRRLLRAIKQPCVSARSMISLSWGVVYAGRDRPVVIGENGQEINGQDYFERDSWRAFLPDVMRAVEYGDRYIAFSKSGFDANGKAAGSGIVISSEDNVGGVGRIDQYMSAAHFDTTNGNLYVYQHSTGQISQWDGDTSARMTGTWRSGTFVLPKPENMGAFKVDADFGATVEEAAASATARAAAIVFNQALIDANEVNDAVAENYVLEYPVIGGALIDVPPLSPRWSITLTYRTNGIVRAQRTITTNNPLRLPGGFKDDNHEVELSGTAAVYRFLLGETPTALERK